MTWRKTRRWLAVVCCVAIVAFYFVVRYVGNTLIAPANHPVGPPPADLPVVTTTIASESGSTLATWYIPAAESHATVVLLHSIRADRRSMLGRARLFRDAGYTIVMVDLQAHGESLGEHITVGYLERLDVRAAVSFARQRNPGHKIAIVGCSLGGAATLLASPLDINAAVLESVYPTLSEAVHNRISMRLGALSYALSPILIQDVQFRSGLSASDLCPINHIAEIGCPVLIAGGDRDEHTTLAETQRMFDTAREPKKRVVFQDTAHVDLLESNPEQYGRDVLSFLAAHLK